MRLAEKVRHGSKLTRRHDRARTPYRRILASPLVGDRAKQALTQTYEAPNPVELKLEIARSQDRLVEIARTKAPEQKKEVNRNDHPWRRTFSPRQLRLKADISGEATREPIRTS